MKKTYSGSKIEKEIIGEIVGFDREEESDACELVSGITGDNSRDVVSVSYTHLTLPTKA